MTKHLGVKVRLKDVGKCPMAVLGLQFLKAIKPQPAQNPISRGMRLHLVTSCSQSCVDTIYL